MEKPLLHGIRKGCYKCLFVFLGLIIQQFGLYAQDETSASSFDLNFGFKAGATISSFTNQQPHNNIISGFAGGAFVAYPINGNMEVQAEVFYAQEGGRLLTFDLPYLIGKDYWYDLVAENQRIVINMLNVPILYKYILPVSDTKLSLFIGPNFGYRLNAISKKEATVLTESGSFHTYTETEDISSNITKYSFAAIAGVSVEIDVGDYSLLLEGRYKNNFSTLYESYSYVGIPQVVGDIKCHTVFFSVGIVF